MGALTALIAVALVSISFSHHVTPNQLDTERAFLIALGGADALCDTDSDGTASGETCAACILVKSLNTPTDGFSLAPFAALELPLVWQAQPLGHDAGQPRHADAIRAPPYA